MKKKREKEQKKNKGTLLSWFSRGSQWFGGIWEGGNENDWRIWSFFPGWDTKLVAQFRDPLAEAAGGGKLKQNRGKAAKSKVIGAKNKKHKRYNKMRKIALLVFWYTFTWGDLHFFLDTFVKHLLNFVMKFALECKQ